MTIITVRDLVVDDRRRIVTLAGDPVELSRIPFDFLAKLASDPERAWRVDELLRDVWGFQSVAGVGSNAVAICATKVRKRLHHRFVFSVRGVGYRLLDI